RRRRLPDRAPEPLLRHPAAGRPRTGDASARAAHRRRDEHARLRLAARARERPRHVPAARLGARRGGRRSARCRAARRAAAQRNAGDAGGERFAHALRGCADRGGVPALDDGGGSCAGAADRSKKGNAALGFQAFPAIDRATRLVASRVDTEKGDTMTRRSLQRALACAALATAPLVVPVQAAAQETIRFGAPLPLTGALAPEALKQQQGYDLWAEQVNKAGGIDVGGKKMKVEIVYTDYQSNTPRAVQAAERLI